MKLLPKLRDEWQTTILFCLFFPFMAFCLPPLVSKLVLKFCVPRNPVVRAIESEISDTFAHILFWPSLILGVALLIVYLYGRRAMVSTAIEYVRRKPLLKGVISFLALLIVLEFATYAVWANKAMVQTIRQCFPPHVRLEHDTESEIACISQRSWDSLSALQQETAQAMLSQKFEALYVGTENIPPEKWVYGPDRPNDPIGPADVCFLFWEFKKGILWFRGHYGHSKGGAGSNSSASYIWAFGKWVKVREKTYTFYICI